ncbi:MAG: PQQ-binding-like beta-propeller repeat protein, partial [Planctomycetales bacterium]|nr:PQQ-binding-like beta-propeller repeat protein [Planctomycetales bacterium]
QRLHYYSPQYVQLTQKHVVGINAKDGSLVWQSEWPGRVAVIPTPVSRGEYVYVTSGYGVGCKLVKLLSDGQIQDVYENKNMKNHHGGVILLGDHLFGHSDGVGWMCQDFKSGEITWNEKSFGKGAIGYADGMFYCLSEDDGTVVLIEASTEGWKEHGRFKLEPQSEIRSSRGRIWTHPVIAGGKLYLRDQDLIYCFDVQAK